jgi:DNA polymerase-3 subunit gamma/tau
VAFQSLYRRYRPRRFGEVRGQEHVMLALRNAVANSTVAHAYLFSGPRGTGKTSSARILAKALNCESPIDGEPDGTCESCQAVEAGRSLDVVELDAASNNGVDAMRDLVGRVALGTGGRAKVYIVDEVHMLSAAASNALLKTLEEPPAHVTFVLATTDPQKVLPTIRSRTQHYEFRLLPTTILEDHLRWVVGDAGLTVTDDAVALAARRGKGSARDALSALDQIVAAGGEADEDPSLDELTEALCERDTGRALAAVAAACNAGREPRQLAESFLAHLRDALLAVLAPEVVTLPDEARDEAADQGRRLGPPAIVRALDAVGEALLAMKDAPDPRVTFEVALVRVTRPELDTSPAAIVERLEKLERGVAAGPITTGATPATVAPAAAPPPPPPPPPPRPGTKRALGAVKGTAAPTASPAPGPEPAPEAPAEPAPAAAALPAATGDPLAVWAEARTRLRKPVEALYAGAAVSAGDGVAVFTFAGAGQRDLAEQRRPEVEAAMGMRVRLEVGGVAAPAPLPDEPEREEPPDLSDLQDAPPESVRSPIDQLTSAFPGTEIVDDGR